MAKNKLLMNKKTADTEFVKQIAQQTPEEALKTLHSSLDGLSSTEAKERLEKNGLNEVATKKHNTKLHFFIESFFTPFTMVLLLLATVSLFTDYVFVPADQKDLSTVIIMITMIIISGLTSFIQNVKTNDAVEDLLNMVSVTTNIRRNKKDKEISTKQVVVGDIINIHAGDMVPADIRLLQTKDLFCSSSSLNGESTPVEKIATKKPDQKDMDQYLDYPDVIYQGTTIVSGSGVGVVLATGEQTVFGRLAKDISNNDVKETNFDVGIKNISKLLLTMTAIIAPLVLIINGLTKGNWLNALLFAIATAVGLTPEMLPVIVTSNLVKGSLEMSKHGTIVKKMNSIQNFGAADILCTDKTGTLTQNKVVLERHYNLDMKENPQVLRLAYLNSYFQTGMHDLMDQAIIDAASDELDVEEIKHDYTKVDEIPFDFKRRRMSVVVKRHGDGRILVTKGAAEEMLACCNRVQVGNHISDLTDEYKEKVLKHIEDLNKDGLRVVLLAYQNNPAQAGEFNVSDEKDLILTGFLAFLDPPKDDVKGVLKKLKQDGITVKILTGDNAAVTKSVASRVGLNTEYVYSEKDFVGKMLDEVGIPHAVLNAKNHAKEAQIIMNAGQRGAVTIATNMAGRGTDIKLGPGVKELGGLAVIGTERHESRRIDNQLRGRSGRQGDPGYTRFYLSLEDDLMKRFGGDRVKDFLDRLSGNDEDKVIESRLITRQVESAQKRVEGNNYDTRKQTLQYDDVMRIQREIIYGERMQVIEADKSLKNVLIPMIHRTINSQVDMFTQGDRSQWRLDSLRDFISSSLTSEKVTDSIEFKTISVEDLKKKLYDIVEKNFEDKEKALGDPSQMLEFEKVVILRVVDDRWTDHIDAMDQLRQSIGLRGYGQLNPLVEYQDSGYRMFEEMISNIEFDVTRLFMKAEIRQNLSR